MRVSWSFYFGKSQKEDPCCWKCPFVFISAILTATSIHDIRGACGRAVNPSPAVWGFGVCSHNWELRYVRTLMELSGSSRGVLYIQAYRCLEELPFRMDYSGMCSVRGRVSQDPAIRKKTRIYYVEALTANSTHYVRVLE